MTPKTKEADRSSPVSETGDSMARAPTQEPASPDARVQPSARKTSHQNTRSQGQSRRGGRGRVPIFRHLSSSLHTKQDRGEEHITQETSREIKEADVQDDTSSQQMNSDIRSTHSGRRDGSCHHSRHDQTHDERGGANVREDVDDGGANEGEGEREREVKEAEGDELSTNQNLRPSHPVRKPYNKREDVRDVMFRTLRRENDGTSSQQMNSNIRSTHSGRRDDSGHHSRHGQTSHDERDGANVREDVDDGGANVGGGGEREVKKAEGNGLSTNQSLPPPSPTRNSVANDGEGGEGEKGVKEVKGNELSTNQGLCPSNDSNTVRRHHRRRESARNAILRLEGTLRSRERDVNVLSTRNEQMSDEIKILKEGLARLQLERDQTGQLLHEMTVELSSARLFLCQADAISVTDVSRMVDLLNAEISQASNSIADSLSYRQVTPATSDITYLNRSLHKGRSSIGARLCDILARRLCQPGAEFDPMITQLALQAGLSNACYLIINDWNPPFWDSSSTVNANTRLSVGQVTAGPRRALTRTYINEDGIQGQDAKEGIREANADYLRSTLRDLLTIVGWSSRDPHHDLPSEYNEKMRFLSDEALKLHETIGRGITTELIVDSIPCETPFDPTKMDNADRQRGKPDAIPDDTVACTVELGLRYKTAKPGGDSEEIGVILKPKVLLASVLVGEDKEVTPPKPQD